MHVDPGFVQLTPRLLSSVETKSVKNGLQASLSSFASKLCFQLQPAALHHGGLGAQLHRHGSYVGLDSPKQQQGGGVLRPRREFAGGCTLAAALRGGHAVVL